MLAPAQGGEAAEPTFLSVGYGAVRDRAPDYQVLETVAAYRRADGQVLRRTNTITVLETGMFYRQDGQLLPSREQIELVAGGAVARQGPHRVTFPGNLNSGRGVQLEGPDGRTFRFQILGLSYYQPATGRSAWIATIQDSVPVLDGPNKLVFGSAFRGVDADVVYEYKKAAFAQDVVLRPGGLPEPASLGFDEDARLQVVTEFLEAPEPRKDRRTVPGESGLVDDTLDFGAYRMASGRAFPSPAADQADGAEPVLPVLKRWERVDGRVLLFESVHWRALQRWLEAQPRQASTDPGGDPEPADILGPSRSLALSEPPDPPVYPVRPGVVLDFTLLTSTGTITLAGDTNYLVMGLVTATALVIEGGTVVKYTNSSTACIQVSGSVTCRTRPYGPAIFTAIDQDSIGEIIPASRGTPPPGTSYANPALRILADGTTLENVRFSYASSAIVYQPPPGSSAPHTVRHAQFVTCLKGIVGYGQSATAPLVYYLGNGLMAGVTNPFRGGAYMGTVEHLTADRAAPLAVSSSGLAPSSLYFRNGVFANVTSLSSGPVTISGSHNGFYTAPTFGDQQVPVQSNPFSVNGAASYYLADTSFEDQGDGAINATLAADLKRKTVWEPVAHWSGLLNTDMTYPDPGGAFLVPRDTGTPDLGWHYDPLDLVVSDLAIEQATLVLTNVGAYSATGRAIAIAVHGATGFKLRGGAKVIAEGIPTSLVRLAPYYSVQEQSNPNWATPGASLSFFSVEGQYSQLPEVRLRYTELSRVANSIAKRLILDNHDYFQIGALALEHCRLWGATLSLSLYPYSPYLGAMAVGLTNNFAHRVNFALEQDTDSYQPRLEAHLRNNLFWHGRLSLADYTGTGAWSARDNLFDTVSLTGSSVPNSYNGYLGTSTLPGSAGHDVQVTCGDYVPGPLGDYYYPTSGGCLTALINAGSRSAADAKLYLHTTAANQAPEGVSQVDIGHHYAPIAQLATVLINGEFNGAVDADYHPVNQSLIVSVNYDSGYPYNLARVAANGYSTQWSNIIGNDNENPLATARTTGYGFIVGETYFASSTQPVIIWKVPALGSPAQLWTTLADDFWPGGLCLDTTGLFGHDLIVVTGWLVTRGGGGVWRVNGQTAQATLITDLGTCLEGVLVCPENAGSYGPWAGKLLVGAGDQRSVYQVEPNSNHTSTSLGFSPHDFHVIPSGQPLYAVRYVPDGPSNLLKVAPEFFANVAGDILVVQSGEFYDPWDFQDNGYLFLVHWTGTDFITQRISDEQQRWLEHAVFAPISLPVSP